MDEAIGCYLETLTKEVQAAAGLADATRQSACWSIGQLPALYAKFRQSSESRHCDEITRLVQGVVNVLAESTPPSPTAQHLATTIPVHLRQLHEQAGLPAITLKTLKVKAPRKPAAKARKVG